MRELRDWLEELACRAGLDGLPAMGRVGKPLALVACAIGVAWFFLGSGAGASVGGGSPATPGSLVTSSGAVTATTSAAPAAPASVTVHVVGEVRHPGVYELRAGSRARDAVDAAGGLLGDAEQAAINLARIVADGEQIAVPRQGEAAAAAGSAAVAGATAGGKVDINTATVEQLDALPGVGPATATKIVSDRTANGPFRTVDDLMRVPGIGPAKFDALKDLISAG